MEFHDHRPYVPGDDPRDLDWSLYLRLEQLAIKEYARSEAPEVQIILDRSASMGAEGSGKDRIVREISAGIASAALLSAAPTSVFVLAETGPVAIGRYLSHRKLDLVLNALQTLPDPRGATHLAELIRIPAARAAGRLVFLLSDFLVDPLPTAALLALSRGSGTGCLLQVVAHEERHLRLHAARTLADPESTARLPVLHPAPLLEAYRAELTKHETAVAHLARAHALRHVVVSDHAPFEEAVLASIGRRDP